MKVGFIGLGNLGRPMAERLLSQGVELMVWNRTLSKADGLSAEVAYRPAESEVPLLNRFSFIDHQSEGISSAISSHTLLGDKNGVFDHSLQDSSLYEHTRQEDAFRIRKNDP